MTLLRNSVRLSATLLCIAAAADYCAAQQSSDALPTATPAPIVRKTPRPASATPLTSAPADGPAVTPHLTVARPVARTPSSSATTAAPQSTTLPPKPAPAPKSKTNLPPTTGQGTPLVSAPPSATTAPVSVNRSVVVLDAAHGGGDTGSRISDQITEKEVDLSLAFHIRSLLTARGFTVVMTRESDDAFVSPEKAATSTAAAVPGIPLSLDDRAGIANHVHPAACLLLHATGVGAGVHLYGSELTPVSAEPLQVPWLKAQAAWVPQSQKLETQLATAFSRARINFVQSNASIRPVDSLTCPGLVLELAPETAGKTASLVDDGYLGRVAEAITGTLVAWQNQVEPPQRVFPPPPPPAAPAGLPPAEVQP